MTGIQSKSSLADGFAPGGFVERTILMNRELKPVV